MMQDKPILCLGIAVADLIGGPLHQMPSPGRLVLVDKMGLFPGGGAVNTSSALARLGLPAALLCKVGADPLGDFLVQTLSDRKVEVSNVKRDHKTGTSATMAMVDPDGERRFVHYIGANANLTLEDISLKLIEETAILHVAYSFVMPGLDGQPMAELLKNAQEVGVTTFLDCAWDAQGRWLDLIAPCLPFVDYMVPNLAEARAITGLDDPADVARFLLDQGVETVAVKMGPAGCLVMAGDRLPHYYSAYQVDVVDATGAGDAFAAGFIAGVYLNWPLDQTARLANAVGALCVTGLGALGGVTSLSETQDFIEKGSIIRQDLQD
ncbi:MAG: carbohydrate kinase family protein [Chloroflexota bacterium]|jgi:sugar/nucleoside kinase (ribokinase family)